MTGEYTKCLTPIVEISEIISEVEQRLNYRIRWKPQWIRTSVHQSVNVCGWLVRSKCVCQTFSVFLPRYFKMDGVSLWCPIWLDCPFFMLIEIMSSVSGYSSKRHNGYSDIINGPPQRFRGVRQNYGNGQWVCECGKFLFQNNIWIGLGQVIYDHNWRFESSVFLARLSSRGCGWTNYEINSFRRANLFATWT